MITQRSLALLLVTSLAITRAAGSEERLSTVAITVEKGHIDFRCGPDLAASYITDANQPRPYFWPLHGPRGLVLTRGWPMEKPGPGEMTDHVHHRSAWFCHGDVIPEGLELKHKIK